MNYSELILKLTELLKDHPKLGIQEVTLAIDNDDLYIVSDFHITPEHEDFQDGSEIPKGTLCLIP